MKEKKIIEKEYKKYYPIFVKILGSQPTFEDDLNKVGKKLFKNKFKGVFAIDDKFKICKNGYYIVNTGKRQQGGAHWVAIADKLFFDSFGRTPKSLGFNVEKHTEDDVEQKINSFTCGCHCMTFLYLYNKYGKHFAKWI